MCHVLSAHPSRVPEKHCEEVGQALQVGRCLVRRASGRCNGGGLGRSGERGGGEYRVAIDVRSESRKRARWTAVPLVWKMLREDRVGAAITPCASVEQLVQGAGVCALPVLTLGVGSRRQKSGSYTVNRRSRAVTDVSVTMKRGTGRGQELRQRMQAGGKRPKWERSRMEMEMLERRCRAGDWDGNGGESSNWRSPVCQCADRQGGEEDHVPNLSRPQPL